MSAPDTAEPPFPKEKVEAALRTELAKAYPSLNAPMTALGVNPFVGVGVNPFAQLQQHNLGMTTQVLPGVSGAQTFNAAALTSDPLVDVYMSTHRQ